MQAGLQAENIGDFDAATNAYREAIAVADALLAERREEDALALAGHLQCNLGVLAWRQQQAEAARTHAEAALGLLAEVRGAASDAIVQRAVAHNLLGVLARDAKDPAGSLQHFRRTAALYERLAAAAPDDYDTRKGLAMALQNVAIAENDGRDFGAAVTTIERALELRRRNVDDFGDVPDCWAGLGAGLTNRAAFLRGLGRHEDSLRSAGEALAAIRTALARDDERAKFAHSLLLAHRAFHSAAVALGRHADVAANARAMAAAPQGDVSWALGAARRLVEASRLVRKDKQLDAARQAALAEEYAATAVATLVAVGERSALTTAELDDPGLRPLRERDDFRALRNKVQERTPR